MSLDTQRFSRTTPLSRIIQAAAKPFFFHHFTNPGEEPSHNEQFPIASKNLEIMLEDLLETTVKHPIKTAPVYHAVGNWVISYFKAQKKTHEKLCFDVYTEHDKLIPFKPQEDIMYAYMISQLAYVASQVTKKLTFKEMKSFVKGFIELNDLAVDTFNQYPTVMPRFHDHDRLTLRVVQHIDEPVNCCPSLHIAYSIYLDNVAQKVLNEPKDKDCFESIRTSTKAMVNSVLYTKQHALIDVAGGILAAQIIFEDTYNDPFNNFIHVFDELKYDHLEIDYDRIERMYNELKSDFANIGSFPNAIGNYLKKHNYPVVRREV